MFYACESCGLEYDEDEALLMNFTCDECGEIFTVKDNSKLIKEMGRNTAKFDEKLKIVQEEIEKEQSKLGKKKAVGLKKEEKENEKRKAEAKERRDQKRKEKKASLPAKKPKTEKKTKKIKENVKSKSNEKIQSRKSIKKSSKKKK